MFLKKLNPIRRIRELTEELSRTRRERDQARKESERLQRQTEDLQRELKRIQEENNQLRKDLELAQRAVPSGTRCRDRNRAAHLGADPGLAGGTACGGHGRHFQFRLRRHEP